ncbi:MAG: circularly permuted type 2 ATP-grasp protein [Ilumatobacteraceae bacterium]
MSITEPRTKPGTWDELLTTSGTPRPVARRLIEHLESLGLVELEQRQTLADLDMLSMGVTFTVYADGRGIDRAWPFDVVPRVIEAGEWRGIEAGLRQRMAALNRFIDDLYNEQQVIADGVFPAELLAESVNYLPECRGMRPKHGVWAHIAGSDLVRDGDGTVYVLEDNLRVPSGVSYMLQNRAASKRALSDIFREQSVLPVDDYPEQLYSMLCSIAPDDAGPEPCVVVLTPGIYNSAYFEHSFLARRMGVPLLEGTDLTVGDDDVVYMRTIEGLERVDVIYRRVNDSFLDPEVFEPDSVLGCAGLLRAWKAGNVALANAPGAGVADDKVVYAWVPDLIRYYLGEEPLLPNVPTYRCCYPDELEHVLHHASELVLKPANESGGYGLTIGNRATEAELDRALDAIRRDPRNWVAQPILDLSTTPTLCHGKLVSRHIDLRPFILSGAESYVTKGGLTRVALVEGSLVVNSSQGGGSKDTWIVELDS